MRSFSVPRTDRKGDKVKHPAYRCQHHDHLTRMPKPTDDYVKDLVFDRVRDSRIVRAMTEGKTDVTQPDESGALSS